MKKFILLFIVFLIMSCSTTKTESLKSKILCKRFDHFNYAMSIPDPFDTYCNTSFIPGGNYIREFYNYSDAVQLERFCQDDRGQYIAVTIDKAGPEAIHMFIHEKYLETFQKNRI